ncbi:MAG: hypothetical protein COB37_06725 [Kordiimonadales bacterium]|nr:MAG: hypothetical protein COB37_06725 [Kordiimonadales bacterium]
MKKILIGLTVLVGASLALIYTQLGPIIKSGIESQGPEVLKVSVSVEHVSLEPFSGHAKISKLVIGQPEGFGDGALTSLGSFSVDLDVASLLSDHIIINELIVDEPLLDVRFKGKQTNFSALQENLDLPTSSEGTSAQSETTLTIKKLIVRAPRLLAKSEGLIKFDQDIILADFTLSDLGTDEKGLAPREIARHIMDAVQPQIAKALIAAGASDKIKKIAEKAKSKLEKRVGGLLGKLNNKKKKQN